MDSNPPTTADYAYAAASSNRMQTEGLAAVVDQLAFRLGNLEDRVRLLEQKEKRLK